MKHREGTFTGYGNQQLYYQSWHPESAAKAVLVFVHGLGEHSSRYMNLVRPLIPRGYALYGFDHRGHGRSSSYHCAHVNDWSEYRFDVKSFVAFVSNQERSLPLFLMGHSMGGLITANYVIYHPEGLQGVVLSAPPLGDVGVSPLLRAFGRLAALMKPDFAVGNGLDVNGISRDPEAVRLYREDPLIHDRVSMRWSVEFFKAIDWTKNHTAEFKPPLLTIHGEGDTLVPMSGSRAFFEKVDHRDKTYISYPEGYHESLNDLHHQQAADDIVNWLDNHLEQ
ncbi:MAG: lysophospholipase [Thermodesulfobacteriota bacterium]